MKRVIVDRLLADSPHRCSVCNEQTARWEFPQSARGVARALRACEAHVSLVADMVANWHAADVPAPAPGCAEAGI